MTEPTPETWPPSGPTTVQRTIPAYLYVQYQGDDAVAAFFDAYNIWAQAYTDWFNNLNLPIYTQPPVSGTLLDWVAQGLYGISRPSLPTSIGAPYKGPVNSFYLNELTVNGYKPGLPDTYAVTNDDFFRRIITWKFYKGDGKAFSPRWLKRRLNRFLTGANGKDVPNDTTYNVSVFPTGFKAWTIQLANSTESAIFEAAVRRGVIDLPFQITWDVVLV